MNRHRLEMFLGCCFRPSWNYSSPVHFLYLCFSLSWKCRCTGGGCSITRRGNRWRKLYNQTICSALGHQEGLSLRNREQLMWPPCFLAAFKAGSVHWHDQITSGTRSCRGPSMQGHQLSERHSPPGDRRARMSSSAQVCRWKNLAAPKDVVLRSLLMAATHLQPSARGHVVGCSWATSSQPALSGSLSRSECINEEFALSVEEPEINKQDTSLVLFCFLATAIKAALRLSHKQALQIQGFIFPRASLCCTAWPWSSSGRALHAQPYGPRATRGQPPAEQALTHAVCNQHHFNQVPCS